MQRAQMIMASRNVPNPGSPAEAGGDPQWRDMRMRIWHAHIEGENPRFPSPPLRNQTSIRASLEPLGSGGRLQVCQEKRCERR